MHALKIGLSLVALVIGLISAWIFLPPTNRLDKQIVNQPLQQPFSFVGYKVISSDPSIDPIYHYYIVGGEFVVEGEKLNDTQPFLITADPFVKLKAFDESTIHISVTGKIELYNNDLWIQKSDGKVHHWYINMHSKYIR